MHGPGCPLRASGLLSSRRKGHARLLKKLSTAGFGIICNALRASMTPCYTFPCWFIALHVRRGLALAESYNRHCHFRRDVLGLRLRDKDKEEEAQR